MERWISIHSRGHSDYRLTGDLHAPLQRAEHVFILFFFSSALSSVLLWPGAADTRVSNRAEHRRDKARGALIMNEWHWWWGVREGGKSGREQEGKRALWLKEHLQSILTLVKLDVETLAVLVSLTGQAVQWSKIYVWILSGFGRWSHTVIMTVLMFAWTIRKISLSVEC